MGNSYCVIGLSSTFLSSGSWDPISMPRQYGHPHRKCGQHGPIK